MALSHGAPPRSQAFAAQADAQPFAALLEAVVSTVPDSSAGASAQTGEQKPSADTGATVQPGAAAAASASAPSAGATAQGSAGSGNSARDQSADAGAPQGAVGNIGDGRSGPAPDANNSANLTAAAPASDMPIQLATADGKHQATTRNSAERKLGPMLDVADGNEPAMPPPLSNAAGNPNASSGTSPDPTINGGAQSANEPSASDALAADKSGSGNTAAALLAAAVGDLNGPASANNVTPGVSKPSGDGKDDQRDQDNGSADAATALSANSQAPLPSPAPAPQPLAAAIAVNAAPDSAPPAAAKPGLAIADAIKARPKILPTPAATAQILTTDAGATDAPGSSSAADAGASNDSPAASGPDDTTGSASAANAQQAIDQLETPGANVAALLNQIDFASAGATAHFSSRGDAAAFPNGAAASAAPNGIVNAATLPAFGILAPNAVATNIAAPAAAASEPTVPLAGLAVAIAARARAGSSQFDIRLDPPELGRIDVRLDLDGSGQVRTHVTVDRADTLQLMQSQQPQLERALEQAGLKTADNGLQFTLRDQSFAGQNGGGGRYDANQPAAPLVIREIDAAPIDTAQIYARLRLGNGLDISV